MKRISILLAVLFTATAFVLKQDNGGKFRSLKNNDFARGERFKYVAHYLGINGGEAVVELDKNLYDVNGRKCYRVNVDGKTTGVASWLYNVNDRWGSYIDTGAVTSHKFYRNIEEGKNYKLDETIIFDHKNKIGKLVQTMPDKEEKKQFEFPDYPQDMVSGYYYLRTIDFDKKYEGDTIQMYGVYEDSVYDMKVRYLGKEVLKTNFGKINSFALSPIMPENELFDGGDAIKFWVSDDKNRVPLLIKAKMFIANVKIELVEHAGLKHDFNFAED
ncbi:DUF3108 domain-containing protein [Flexithrix dorotheae]|uniref:DUF3108 domain-containing protein n=1 Tax=Flexithrix dorotheae TaxID=70993 RepID=UPI0003784985|nr:DUF3108 domain-containing protein [Flexithrix dorotheae]